MKWIYNLKISTKLIHSFLVVLSLTTFLGVFSIIQLARVNQTSTDMEINWMPSMRATSDYRPRACICRMSRICEGRAVLYPQPCPIQ